MLNATGHGLKDVNRVRDRLKSWDYGVVADAVVVPLLSDEEIRASGRDALPCIDGAVVYRLIGYSAELLRNGTEVLHEIPGLQSVMQPDQLANMRRIR